MAWKTKLFCIVDFNFESKKYIQITKVKQDYIHTAQIQKNVRYSMKMQHFLTQCLTVFSLILFYCWYITAKYSFPCIFLNSVAPGYTKKKNEILYLSLCIGIDIVHITLYTQLSNKPYCVLYISSLY